VARGLGKRPVTPRPAHHSRNPSRRGGTPTHVANARQDCRERQRSPMQCEYSDTVPAPSPQAPAMARWLSPFSNRRRRTSSLRRYLNPLGKHAPRRGRGAQTGHFIDHLLKLANSYWPGLL
jgi:hypothetical protein